MREGTHISGIDKLFSTVVLRGLTINGLHLPTVAHTRQIGPEIPPQINAYIRDNNAYIRDNNAYIYAIN